MFDSHDDDLWEVPSIDVDVPAEAAVPEVAPAKAPEAETAASAPEPATAAAPAEAAVAAEDESSTDGYDQAAAEAPEDEGYDMDGLDGKLLEHFGGKIVRKDLTAFMKRGANVPTFVLEYLLGMYCSTDDEEAVAEGLDRIRRILTDNYVRPDESERIKSKIRELGRFTIIDKVTAKLDEYKDIYVASFANLTIEPFVMPAEYVRDYSKILQGGIWCIMSIEYRHPVDEEDEFGMEVFGDDAPRRAKAKRKKRGPEDSPFSVASLTPIQMPNLDLDAMVEERQYFSRDEWLNMLLRSAGYEPSELSEKERLHFIERMVPLIERNYNLCELVQVRATSTKRSRPTPFCFRAARPPRPTCSAV